MLRQCLLVTGISVAVQEIDIRKVHISSLSDQAGRTGKKQGHSIAALIKGGNLNE